MSFELTLLTIAVLSTNLMLWLELRTNNWLWLRRASKAVASACYLLAYVHWCQGYTLLTALVLLGATFAAIGDQYMIRSDKEGDLMIAVWFFICQHLFYVFAISKYVKQDILLLWSLVAIVAFIGFIVIFLRGYLKGAFKFLVPLYAAAISANLIVCISAGTQHNQSLLIAGITLFMVGDLFVASHRFIARHWFNRVADSNAYLLGQFAILYGASQLIQ